MKSSILTIENNIFYKLVTFFIGDTFHSIKKDQLTQFLYLADLYSVKWTGESLTDSDWFLYEGRVSSDELVDTLTELENKQLITIKEELIVALPKLRKPKYTEFPLGLELMLQNILAEWLYSNRLEHMTSYVNQTAPIKEILSSSLNSTSKIKLDLNLERIKLLEDLNS
jgi:hypothetical protein